MGIRKNTTEHRRDAKEQGWFVNFKIDKQVQSTGIFVAKNVRNAYKVQSTVILFPGHFIIKKIEKVFFLVFNVIFLQE